MTVGPEPHRADGCAVASRGVGESPLGTGSWIRSWLVVEHAGPGLDGVVVGDVVEDGEDHWRVMVWADGQELVVVGAQNAGATRCAARCGEFAPTACTVGAIETVLSCR